MKPKLVLIICSLLLLISVPAPAQDDTCDMFLRELGFRLEILHIRVESYAFTVTSQHTDYTAWQDLRLDWQTREPECDTPLRQLTVEMFAALGDLSAHSMYLKEDPRSSASHRLTMEALNRALNSVLAVADEYETITGEKVDVGAVILALDATADRLRTEG